jgi:hypothetical protein
VQQRNDGRFDPSVPGETDLHQQLTEVDHDAHAHLGPNGPSVLRRLVFMSARVQKANRVRAMVTGVGKQKPAAECGVLQYPPGPREREKYPEKWRIWEEELLAPVLSGHPDAIRFTAYEELYLSA